MSGPDGKVVAPSPDRKAKAIFLSGTSSSGKTSIAKLLQQRLEEPFLHVQLDSFIEMLPRLDDPQLFIRMAKGMHYSFRALLDAGNNLIIDHVLVCEEWLQDCLTTLSGCYVLFVGVDCRLEELERREKLRDDRRQGFARAQFSTIHAGKTYDLMVNTGQLTPEQRVGEILRFYHEKQPTAFASMSDKVIRR